MLILDTNHIRVLQSGSAEKAQALAEMLRESGAEIVTTVITVAENLRGQINEMDSAREQDALMAHDRFHRTLNFYSNWRVLQFDHAALLEFKRISSIKGTRRAGTWDLRLLAIAAVHGATVLTDDRRLMDAALLACIPVADWLPRLPAD